MPAELRNCIVEIEDADRSINFIVSVDYDLNGSGAVEGFKIELVRATVWFGKYGAFLDVGDNSRQIETYLAETFRDEILEAVADMREQATLEG